jgi:hypothetical protein
MQSSASGCYTTQLHAGAFHPGFLDIALRFDLDVPGRGSIVENLRPPNAVDVVVALAQGHPAVIEAAGDQGDLILVVVHPSVRWGAQQVQVAAVTLVAGWVPEAVIVEGVGVRGGRQRQSQHHECGQRGGLQTSCRCRGHRDNLSAFPEYYAWTSQSRQKIR